MKDLTEVLAVEKNEKALFEDATEELSFEFFIVLNS